tara:strand:+ start:380 stop:718 length:339 start_codon:yes stop_codon:yes gene_type:complete
MATFNETGSGGAIAAGCPVIVFLDNLNTLYAVGDILYYKQKAQFQGVLEKVVIKKQRAIRSITTQGKIEVTYVDTLNALWNEDELVFHAEAVELATLYFEDLLAALEAVKGC